MFACKHVCAECAVSLETKSRHWVLWNWNNKLLQAALWVLGIEPETSGNTKPSLQPCSCVLTQNR